MAARRRNRLIKPGTILAPIEMRGMAGRRYTLYLGRPAVPLTTNIADTTRVEAITAVQTRVTDDAVTLPTDRSMTQPSPTDEELVEQARRGSELAFRQIVERYESKIMATVRGMLGGSSEVDDSVQEVFVQFFRSLDRYRGDASVETYLKRIAINRSLDALRRRKRSLARFVSHDDPDRNDAEIAAVDDDVDYERRDRVRRVRDAVDALPAKHRAVVVLRMIDGHSTAETSEILGVPYGTVLSRLNRAIDKLKPLLQSRLDDLS